MSFLKEESYQKVLCDNYHDFIDQMIRKGYKYYTLWVDTSTGFSSIQNAKLKDDYDCDSIQIMWDWEEGYHELHIFAENGCSCYSVTRQRIKDMYIDKEDEGRFVIVDDLNNEYTIFFHKDDKQSDDDISTKHKNQYSDNVTVKDLDGNYYDIVLDGWNEVSMYDGMSEVGYINIFDLVQKENDIYSDFWDGWTEAYQQAGKGDTDTLMERIFDEFHVEFVKNN